jgi:hypothetical protein
MRQEDFADLADADPLAPWMQQKNLVGMSPPSRRKSYMASLRLRHSAETQVVHEGPPDDDIPPVSSRDAFGGFAPVEAADTTATHTEAPISLEVASSRPAAAVVRRPDRAVANSDWTAQCIKGETGKPLPILANALTALRAVMSDVFAFDEMQQAPMIVRALSGQNNFLPRLCTDVDVGVVQVACPDRVVRWAC